MEFQFAEAPCRSEVLPKLEANRSRVAESSRTPKPAPRALRCSTSVRCCRAGQAAGGRLQSTAASAAMDSSGEEVPGFRARGWGLPGISHKEKSVKDSLQGRDSVLDFCKPRASIACSEFESVLMPRSPGKSKPASRAPLHHHGRFVTQGLAITFLLRVL